MKRMVKNGNLLDISEGGNLKVGGTIIANGEIRGGDVSASKFYLGTEEMPLVKANPAGAAAGTLEKIKIGDVAYKVGGGSNDKVINLVFPYPRNNTTRNMRLYLDDETWNKVNNCYYITINLYFNDGNPLGVFNLFYFGDNETIKCKNYMSVSNYEASSFYGDEWYGNIRRMNDKAFLFASSDNNGKYLWITGVDSAPIPNLSKAKFDALYKLADKPTQDGTYVLKATVSGGAVTYTWVAQ